MGFDVAIEEGHFISRDGRHAMLIIQTPVKMMDSQKSKELVQALDERINKLPGYVSADVIGGHLHTVSNERVIKRDITGRFHHRHDRLPSSLSPRVPRRPGDVRVHHSR